MKDKPIEEMTVKEFMHWFVSEYDGYYLPGEAARAIDRLSGYCMAKKEGEEYFMLIGVLELLKNFDTLTRVMKDSAGYTKNKA